MGERPCRARRPAALLQDREEHNGGFYDCLTGRRDALFELTDAVLRSDGPVRTLVDLAPGLSTGAGMGPCTAR